MKLTQTQLEQYLSKAAWILKGPVDASDFKVYIFPLLFFKRISDVYNEEYESALIESGGDEEYANLPEFHRFDIPHGRQWKDVLEEKGIKQKWLAEKQGKSFNSVNSYVQNRQQPRLEVLNEIAKILDVDIKDLIISNKSDI